MDFCPVAQISTDIEELVPERKDWPAGGGGEFQPAEGFNRKL